MAERQTQIFAIPKGRIQEELIPLMKKAGITPEEEFFDPNSRKLRFKTNLPDWEMIRVRSFDVATFVAFGAASIGVCGKDVLMEYDSQDIYTPIDLNIGLCRLSVAIENDYDDSKDTMLSHIRVATKYPTITRQHYEKKGIQAECVKLNGAMELAPSLGLCRHIVDLVSSGNTLKANNLKEVETITPISSYLVANRTALKTHLNQVNDIINRFKEQVIV